MKLLDGHLDPVWRLQLQQCRARTIEGRARATESIIGSERGGHAVEKLHSSPDSLAGRGGRGGGVRLRSGAGKEAWRDRPGAWQSPYAVHV